MEADKTAELVLGVPADRLAGRGRVPRLSAVFGGLSAAMLLTRRSVVPPAERSGDRSVVQAAHPVRRTALRRRVVSLHTRFQGRRGATACPAIDRPRAGTSFGRRPAGDRTRTAPECSANWPRRWRSRARGRSGRLGFIFDGRTPVGQVHIGIVHLIELEEPLVWPREAAIDEAGFAPVRDLFRRREEFETWSQFVLEELTRGD